MGNTKIEWTEKSWNPVTGCTKISPGCQNCYAERVSKRLRGRCGYPAEDPFRVTLHPERLEEPLRWRKPSKIFVCSMGDLFHEAVPFDFIDRVFKRINGSPQHDFLILTKRPERMREYFARSMKFPCAVCQGTGCSYCLDHGYQNWEMKPYSNVWLGVTTENQEMADKRIPILLQIPAAVRFVSVEPMLSPVRLILARRYCTNCNYLHWSYNPAGSGFVYKEVYCPECGFAYGYHSPEGNSSIDWVICGSESGQNRRPANIEWIRSLKNQCVDADVPFFLKQMEINGRLVKMPKLDGQVWDQFPEVKS